MNNYDIFAKKYYYFEIVAPLQVEEAESELRMAKSSSRENESSVSKLRKDIHDVVAGNDFNLLLPPANEVYEGYVFTPVRQSFCSQGMSPGSHPGGGWGVWLGGGSPGPHPGGGGGVSRPTPWGVPRPTPGGGGVPGPGLGGVCVPACTEADPPHTHTHSRQLLLRAVPILLECILV